MFKKIIFFILLLSLILPNVVFAKNKEETLNLTPNATSAILIEASTGKILYNKNANNPQSVASLTKMMGLIIVFETIEKGGLSLDEIITVSENAKNMGGTQIWLETGEKISVKDLIKGITLASANDAMVAISERVAGTEEEFVKMMNKKVKEFGLNNTNFKNVTGLDEEGHYSSAYDMAIIAKKLLEHEQILDFTSVYEDYIRENTENKTWISNTNKLVRFYEGADGLKTGYETSAGSCIAATSKRNNLRFIAVLLGYEKVNNRNAETMDLLDYGYNQYEAELVYKKGDIVGSTKMDKADVERINLVVSEDIINLKRKIDKKQDYQYEIEVDELKFPINKGDKIGMMYVNQNNKTIKNIALIADKDIKKISFLNFFLNTFKSIILGNN